jgi:hypothetical protein
MVHVVQADVLGDHLFTRVLRDSHILASNLFEDPCSDCLNIALSHTDSPGLGRAPPFSREFPSQAWGYCSVTAFLGNGEHRVAVAVSFRRVGPVGEQPRRDPSDPASGQSRVERHVPLVVPRDGPYVGARRE